MTEELGSWVRRRARLVGVPAAVGVGCFVLLAASVSVWTGDPAGTTRRLFAVAALLFGFALVGWAGSIMAGRGFENLQHHLSGGTDWTERDSRLAMARIGGFGAGGMVGTSLVSVALT